MADITGYLTPFKLMPMLPTGVTPFRKQFVLSATSTDAGGVPQIADVIRLGVINRGFVIVHAKMDISGTLGASCTLQLRRDTTALTAASTAAAANYLAQTAIDTPSTDFDDSLNIVIAGAVVGATATVTVEALMYNWTALVY